MRAVVNRLMLLLVLGVGAASTVHAGAPGKAPRTEIRLSGDGWRLWRDVKAPWTNDTLFLPPVDMSALPTNPPTGGWAALYAGTDAIPVSVPGTVEAYFWDAIQGDTQTEESAILGDYVGVSWWWRTVDIPASASGKRVLVAFERNRLRSEVFLNEQLVGYDMIGDSTFEIDITDAVKPGEKNTLAVRITDAGGNFLWPDAQVFNWGKYKIPISHGFGGIAGHVDLRIVDAISIDNVYIKNLPEMTAIDVQTTVQNRTQGAATGAIRIDIVPAEAPDTVVFSERYETIALQAGENRIERRVSIPSARLWHYNDPNLYVCKVAHVSDSIDADFFIINGGGLLDGDYTLEADLLDPADNVVRKERWPVSVSRGRLGTLVKEKAGFALGTQPGYYTLKARLIDKDGKQQADGMETLFTVDWKSATLPARGAVIESASHIRDFLSRGFKTELPAYDDGMAERDYIILDNSVGIIPDAVFKTPDGKPGLQAEYFNGRADSKTLVGARIEPEIRKCAPPAGLAAESTVVWTGSLTPKESGSYILCADFLRGRVSIWMDDTQVMERAFGTNRKARFAYGKLFTMDAGKSYAIKVQYVRDGGDDTLELQWQRQLSGTQCDRILDRVANEGTTLIVSGDSTETSPRSSTNAGWLRTAATWTSMCGGRPEPFSRSTTPCSKHSHGTLA